MATRKAVGVRLTARSRDELQRTARRRKTTVSALVRDRLHAAGAPDMLREQRGPVSHLSMRIQRVNVRVGRRRGRGRGLFGFGVSRRRGRPAQCPTPAVRGGRPSRVRACVDGAARHSRPTRPNGGTARIPAVTLRVGNATRRRASRVVPTPGRSANTTHASPAIGPTHRLRHAGTRSATRWPLPADRGPGSHGTRTGDARGPAKRL